MNRSRSTTLPAPRPSPPDDPSAERAPRRRSILVLAPLPPPIHGQSVVTASVVGALHASAEVVVIDPSVGEAPWRRPYSVPVHRAVRWVRALRTLRRAVAPDARDRPDRVYLTPASSTLGVLRDAVAVALVPYDLPIVAHVHVGDYGARLARSRAARAVARRCRRILIPSRYAAGPVREALPEARVAVVPYPVDLGVVPDAAQVAARWAGRPDRPGRILFLSNMIPSKGYGALADAAAGLRDPFEIAFAGAWPTAAAQAAFADRLAQSGLRDRARIWGAVPREGVRDRLAWADVVAFPSTYRHESLSVSVLEAMHAGCAVVGVDHAGLREMVRDGEEGRVVPPHDAPALAEALADTLRQSVRYGQGARRRAQAVFSPDRLRADVVAAIWKD